MVVSVGNAALEHPFLDAALRHKTVLHGYQQLVEHVNGLVDEGDAEVGYLLIVHALHGGGVVLADLVTAGILPHLLIARVQVAPLCQVAYT